MKTSNTLALFASLAFAGILLSLGCLQTGQGWTLLLVIVLTLGWAAFLRFRPSWLSPVLLVGYLAAASFAILAGGSPYILFIGGAFALLAWELTSHSPAPSGTPAHPMTALYHQQHLRLLVVSVGLGLVFAVALLFARLSFPFAGLFFAALLVLFSLYRFFRLIRGH